MKKFVIITLVVAMVAGTAFAQSDPSISLGAWGRGYFTPLRVVGAEKGLNDDGDSYGAVQKETSPKATWDGDEQDSKARAYIGQGVTWGGPVRVGFSVMGNAEFIGFRADIAAEGVGLGDETKIWAKPFSSDILKISIGRIQEDALRGKVATDTGFENFVVGDIGEDSIFNRFDNTPSFLLSSEPIEGLFIGLQVKGAAFTRAPEAYRFIQIGAGYNIADIGHFRAQYVGGWLGTINEGKMENMYNKNISGPLDFESIFNPATSDGYWEFNPSSTSQNTWADFDEDDDANNTANFLWHDADGGDVDFDALYDIILGTKHAQIQVAFALTAIENLLVDIGFKFGLPVTYDFGNDAGFKVFPGINVGLGAKYQMGAFGITFSFVTGAQFKYTDDPDETPWKLSGIGSYARALKDDKSTNGFGFSVNLIPTYELEAFTIGASLGGRFGFSGKDEEGKRESKSSAAQFGFGGFIQKNLAGGLVKAGLAYTTRVLQTDRVKDGDPEKVSGGIGRGVFTIPIILEYSIW